MEKNDLNYLSASRVKTLDSCSWLYWCNYHLKMPQSTNSGALRGTICHLILELLLKKRHKKHYDAILKEGHINASVPVDKVVRKFLKKHDMLEPAEGEQLLFDEPHYELCSNMIIVALKHDFFGEGGNYPRSEYEFKIENENPKYNIRGFIDKTIAYPDQGKLKIIDYKTSKSKFQGKDLDTNVQAMMYSFVATKLWPKLKPIVSFMFLKFPRQPFQELEFNDYVLKGFDKHLESMNKEIDTFSEEKATSNFAADKPRPAKGFSGSLMCGFAQYPGQLKKNGQLMWHCPYKFAFDYYALVEDETGKAVATSFENDLEEKDGHQIKKIKYDGCPRHSKQSRNREFDEFLD